MTAAKVVITRLDHDQAVIATLAQWRHDAFLKNYGLTLADSVSHLVRLAERPPGEAALVAWKDGEPAGVCLLVREELDAPHQLTPWLASLFVPEPLRGMGIGRALVEATVMAAGEAGYGRIHLYTDSAEGFYQLSGWRVEDRFDWDGMPAVLMSRDL
jgi:predicted N-acetyltransferase YhbS